MSLQPNLTNSPTSARQQQLKNIIEAALLAANRPLTLDHLMMLFEHDPQPPARRDLRQLLKVLQSDCAERGVELVEVASGWRYQVRENLTPWIKHLWKQRAPRHSRALLETLSIIAYRQPITRSEIERIRGVSVSSNIVRSLLDYQWVRILAYKESPGRPALYGTTRQFLDYFQLKSLSDLPPLNELKTMQLEAELPEDAESNDEHTSTDIATLATGNTTTVTHANDDEFSDETLLTESEDAMPLSLAPPSHLAELQEAQPGDNDTAFRSLNDEDTPPSLPD